MSDQSQILHGTCLYPRGEDRGLSFLIFKRMSFLKHASVQYLEDCLDVQYLEDFQGVQYMEDFLGVQYLEDCLGVSTWRTD